MNNYNNFKKVTFIFIVLIFSFFIFTYGNNILDEDSINKSNIEAINKYYNSSTGGYSDIFDEDTYLSDGLYFTYYSMGLLQKTNQNEFSKCAPDVENWIKSISIEDILSDDNYDRLDDIFYYIKVSNLLNISIEDEKYNQLIDFLIDIQQPEGYFYKSSIYNEEDFDASKKYIDPRVILATVNSVEVLSKTKKINIELLDKWLNKLSSTIKNEEDPIAKLGYINAYIKINSMLNLPISNEINTIACRLIENFNTDIKKFNSSTENIYILNSIYELDGYVNNNKNKKLYQYICYEILSNNDDINSNFHAAIYYYIINILDASIDNAKEITTNILARKVPNSFFIGDIVNSIDIIATNYAFKILDILDYSYDPTQLVDFLSENINDKSILEKINFIDIVSRSDIKNTVSNNLLKSLLEESSSIDFIGDDNFANYSLIANIINTTKNSDIPIPSDLCKKLLAYANTNRNANDSFDINNFLYNCTDLIILRNLSENKEQIKLKEKIIIDTINKNYDNLDDELKYYILYFGLLSIGENKDAIDNININRMEIKKELRRNQINGLYYINEKTYPNMETQYIVNLLLSKL